MTSQERSPASAKKPCYSKLFVLVCAFVAMDVVITPTWAQAQSTPRSSVTSSAQNAGAFELGEAFVAPGSVAKQQTRLIFYRANTSSFQGGASIYFNDMYHATLERNAYSFLCVNPGAVNLGVKPVKVGSQDKDRYDSISALELQAGGNQYVRVVEDGVIKVLQPVREAEALLEIAGSREQIHTLSRVTPAQVCRHSVAETPKPKEPVQTMSLGADALFDFAGSGRKALGVQGRVVLDNLMNNVRANYSIVNHVRVIGYADPIGSEQQNERLSFERAQTVKEYLQENGLQSSRITAQGRGSSALVVSTCGRAATEADIACNSPNRRVMVEISGTRR